MANPAIYSSLESILFIADSSDPFIRLKDPQSREERQSMRLALQEAVNARERGFIYGFKPYEKRQTRRGSDGGSAILLIEFHDGLTPRGKKFLAAGSFRRIWMLTRGWVKTVLAGGIVILFTQWASALFTAIFS